MADRFSAVVRTDGSAVLELIGDLDASASPVLSAAWTEAIASGTSRVVLDFSAMGYMNSTGIALIVELLGRARAARIDLAARGLSQHYRQIFEITRLTDFIALEPEPALPRPA